MKGKIRPLLGRLIFVRPFADLIDFADVTLVFFYPNNAADFDYKTKKKSGAVKGICSHKAVYVCDRRSI